MRIIGKGVGLTGLAAMLAGCVAQPVELARVDPQDAADRAMIGSVLGAALGTGLGASFAINPAIGSVIGVEAGAALGAAAGALTAQPLPDYRPIVVPAEAVIPGFYDTWPPGSHVPPIPSQLPPPKPG